jgi:hypothetical protein
MLVMSESNDLMSQDAQHKDGPNNVHHRRSDPTSNRRLVDGVPECIMDSGSAMDHSCGSMSSMISAITLDRDLEESFSFLSSSRRFEPALSPTLEDELCGYPRRRSSTQPRADLSELTTLLASASGGGRSLANKVSAGVGLESTGSGECMEDSFAFLANHSFGCEGSSSGQPRRVSSLEFDASSTDWLLQQSSMNSSISMESLGLDDPLYTSTNRSRRFQRGRMSPFVENDAGEDSNLQESNSNDGDSSIQDGPMVQSVQHSSMGSSLTQDDFLGNFPKATMANLNSPTGVVEQVLPTPTPAPDMAAQRFEPDLSPSRTPSPTRKFSRGPLTKPVRQHSGGTKRSNQQQPPRRPPLSPPPTRTLLTEANSRSLKALPAPPCMPQRLHSTGDRDLMTSSNHSMTTPPSMPEREASRNGLLNHFS